MFIRASALLLAAHLIQCLYTVPLSAAVVSIDSEIKIKGADTVNDDFFGVSTAVSQNTAILGAHRDKDAGRRVGAAYLFDVNNGSELFKLTPSDAALGREFGFSVGISGNTAIVGSSVAPNEKGVNSGAAYLFDVTTGQQLLKLTSSDGEELDMFGFSVAIDGNAAIVGAWGGSDSGYQSGSAYLFDVSTGNQIHKLTASDAAAVDLFGCSVAISGNMAIVGASSDDDGGSKSGSAYLFDVITGEELHKLTASDAAKQDFFGASVAISGNIALIGAVGNDSAGHGSGSAYLFDIRTGEELFKLTASDASTFDSFGSAVAISGDVAIVGAFAADAAGTYSGAAYLFDVNTGKELLKLNPSDASARKFFGSSVAIEGETLLVGANDDGNAGLAYIFESVVVPEPTAIKLLPALLIVLVTRRKPDTIHRFHQQLHNLSCLANENRPTHGVD